MTRTSIAALLLFVTSVVTAAAVPAQETPPSAAPKRSAPPIPSVAKEDAEKARRVRIEAVQKTLAAEVAKIDTFGHTEEFRAALEELEKKYGEIEIGKERWAPVTRGGQPSGYLPMNSIDRWLEWNGTVKGKSVPVALDVALKDHPFGAIVDLSNQLHDHDVEMLLVVFPSRVQLCPELACETLGELSPTTFRGMVGATTRFLQKLSEQGVEVVDLAPDFVEQRFAKDVPPDQDPEIYLTRNKHWAPRGAELAAKIVSDRIRAMPWFVEGVFKDGEQFNVRDKLISYSTKEGNGQAPDKTPEKLAAHIVRQRGGPVNRRDERDSPIVVLGDSFAKFYEPDGASFPDHLRRFTGWAIDVVDPPGGAEGQCRQTLARRHDGMRGKKVVVWLLQEENLRPNSDFEPIDVFQPR